MHTIRMTSLISEHTLLLALKLQIIGTVKQQARLQRERGGAFILVLSSKAMKGSWKETRLDFPSHPS